MARILVVDDVPTVTALIRALLEPEGHDVLESSDGEEALNLAGSIDFDLIITDMMMPGLDGIETVKQLRSTGFDGPIIAMSGGAAGFPAAMSLKMSEMYGADRLLFKPFVNDELTAAVRSLLKPAR